MLALPSSINIMGTPFSVTYCDKPSDVDHEERDSLFGQIDYWKCSIRIYNKRPTVEIWKTIFHELLHGLAHSANIKILKDKDNHDELDLLAEVLVDTVIRNGWIKVEE